MPGSGAIFLMCELPRHKIWINKNSGRKVSVSMPSTELGEDAVLDGLEMEIKVRTKEVKLNRRCVMKWEGDG